MIQNEIYEKLERNEHLKQENIKADKILDCIGSYCPLPILKSAQEIKQIQLGQVLEVINNDPAALQDIPRWAKSAGHRFLKLFRVGNNFHFLIMRGK